ncbi:MAG TPA: hypothetical protein PLO62_02900 [Candidatus Hydrogenedentes bacterium]|nr:hypothetical protein [Candidatus Hydrogenedentota bacterium]HOS01707.1 hypothetical protein [Candidatus Hydrogenedentota bacterium]
MSAETLRVKRRETEGGNNVDIHHPCWTFAPLDIAGDKDYAGIVEAGGMPLGFF